MLDRLRPLTRYALPATLVVGTLGLGLLPLTAHSEDVGEVRVRTLATPASKRAAERALKWLVDHQKEDGAWHCDVGFKLNETYRVEYRNQPHVGVTALAGTAFLASGSVPGRGRYSESVERALKFILKSQDADGFISAHGTRMYSHAFATMFLAEVYGMTNDQRVRKALERAVEFTYTAQNEQGGWRYVPNAEDSDMSITVCQVVALRAAKNKGIRVPKESIDKAVDYVLNSAVTQDGFRGFREGAFLYQWDAANQEAARNTRTSFALTAAGVTTLYGAGIYDDGDIKRFIVERDLEQYTRRNKHLPRFDSMLRYILSRYEDEARGSRSSQYFFFYGNYYAAQAMFIAGGRWWEEYYPRVRDELIRNQLEDGSYRSDVQYRNPETHKVEYPMSTAVAAMLLQVPNNYLPIFQR